MSPAYRSEKRSRASEEGQKATQPRKLAHGVNFTHLFEGVVVDAHVRLVAATDVRVPIAAQVAAAAAFVVEARWTAALLLIAPAMFRGYRRVLVAHVAGPVEPVVAQAPPTAIPVDLQREQVSECVFVCGYVDIGVQVYRCTGVQVYMCVCCDTHTPHTHLIAPGVAPARPLRTAVGVADSVPLVVVRAAYNTIHHNTRQYKTVWGVVRVDPTHWSIPTVTNVGARSEGTHNCTYNLP